MGRRSWGGGALGLAALLACGLSVLPAGASGNGPSIADINALKIAISETAARLDAESRFVGAPVSSLVSRAGMSEWAERVHKSVTAPERALPPPGGLTPPWTPVTERAARADRVNFRLALAILSQTYGAKDDFDVLAAQGGRAPEAVSFRGGIVTLADIEAEMRALGVLDRPLADGGAIRRPIVLWEDTILRLGPEDHLALSRPDGAFVISFGQVDAQGSTISVAGGENPHNAEFMPFLTVGGGGALRLAGVYATGLGFGQTEKFSGVGVAAHPLMPRVGRTRIEASVFDGVTTVVLAGAFGAEIVGNRFHDMRRVGLAIGASPYTEVRGNTFDGVAPTNSIRVFNGSHHAALLGNTMIGGDRLGILVERGADYATVAGNLVSERSGGAIKFDRISCGIAAHNIVLDSRQKGIQVRASQETLVRDNLIVGNGSAALWVSAQAEDARSYLVGNIVQGNRSGLSTATGAAILLRNNDFSAQSPRLFEGDIAHLALPLLGQLHKPEPVLLAPAGPQVLSEAPVPQCNPGEGF
ncbi:MAG: right-handed parallel beta-helix repeat-containing protein [Pseudomonadota bacterium]